MTVEDNAFARATVFEHIERLEGDPNFGEPTAQMREDHDYMMHEMRQSTHKTDRGKKELALALDIPQSRFEALFAGKAVLDIGCGEGVLDYQLSRNRSTHITALDYDSQVLTKVPDAPNIRKVEGSGYDLQAALGDEEFDVVLSAFSTLTWARNSEQAEQGINAALAACKVGGITIFIPLLQHVNSHDAYKATLAIGKMPGYPDGTVHPEGIRYAKSAGSAEDWLRVFKVKKLQAAENSGQIACAYIASAQNRTKKRLNPALGPEHYYEDYSVVATVLEK